MKDETIVEFNKKKREFDSKIGLKTFEPNVVTIQDLFKFTRSLICEDIGHCEKFCSKIVTVNKLTKHLTVDEFKKIKLSDLEDTLKYTSCHHFDVDPVAHITAFRAMFSAAVDMLNEQEQNIRPEKQQKLQDLKVEMFSICQWMDAYVTARVMMDSDTSHNSYMSCHKQASDLAMFGNTNP